MADLIVQVRSITLQATNLLVEFEAQWVPTGQLLGGNKSFNAAAATTSNAMTAFKNTMQTFAQDNFGATPTHANILVSGGFQ